MGPSPKIRLNLNHANGLNLKNSQPPESRYQSERHARALSRREREMNVKCKFSSPGHHSRHLLLLLLQRRIDCVLLGRPRPADRIPRRSLATTNDAKKKNAFLLGETWHDPTVICQPHIFRTTNDLGTWMKWLKFNQFFPGFAWSTQTTKLLRRNKRWNDCHK